VRKQL